MDTVGEEHSEHEESMEELDWSGLSEFPLQYYLGSNSKVTPSSPEVEEISPSPQNYKSRRGKIRGKMMLESAQTPVCLTSKIAASLGCDEDRGGWVSTMETPTTTMGDKAMEHSNTLERETLQCDKMINSGDEFSPTVNTSAITSTPINQSKLSKKKKRDLPRTLFTKDDGLSVEVGDNMKQKEDNVSYQGDEISFSRCRKSESPSRN